jgi:uncharacterized protein with GYD domain
MSTFIMIGKYSSGALKEISAKRTEKANHLIEKCGGRIQSMYALLGGQDLMLIADFPGIKEAMKASVALSKLTSIGFVTSPAVTVEEFDKLMAKA